VAAQQPTESPLSYLRVDIDLLDDPDDASLFIAGLNETAPAFGAGSQQLDLPAFGDESMAVGIYHAAASGLLDEVWLFIRVDRVVATLIASSLTGGVDPADLEAYAELIAQRISAVLDGSDSAS
jgi:hypothetical protein